MNKPSIAERRVRRAHRDTRQINHGAHGAPYICYLQRYMLRR